jgi:hypothetical protein
MDSNLKKLFNLMNSDDYINVEDFENAPERLKIFLNALNDGLKERAKEHLMQEKFISVPWATSYKSFFNKKFLSQSIGLSEI